MEHAMSNLQAKDIADLVPHDTAEAHEIGFSIPDRYYNARAILFDNLSQGTANGIAATGPAGSRNYADLCRLRD